jgi:Lysyl oxidase
VLVLAAALAALQVASPCQDPALALRCPDLVMAAPSRLRAQRLPSGRQVLRMENRIVNIGAGPAEFFAQRSGPRQMAARQVIADGAGVRRRFETGADLYYTSVPARGGDYWKFDDAARFELWAQLPDGRRGGLLRIGPKLRYCLRDRARLFAPAALPGTPRRRVYPACNQTPTKREVTLGTSIGWADIYPNDYPGNFVEIGGLPGGCYVVLHRVDPEQHVLELSESNNVAAKVVRLPFRPGRQGCPRYVPEP